MKKKVIVYTNETCLFCKEVTEKMKEEKIKFTEKSIDKFQKDWDNVVNTVHMNPTPIVFFKDTYFLPQRDFGTADQVIQILKNYEKPVGGDNLAVSERIKTLSFNLMNMVNGLHNIVKEINKKLGIEDEHKSTS